jgi:hypothetical protein
VYVVCTTLFAPSSPIKYIDYSFCFNWFLLCYMNRKRGAPHAQQEGRGGAGETGEGVTKTMRSLVAAAGLRRGGGGA